MTDLRSRVIELEIATASFAAIGDLADGMADRRQSAARWWAEVAREAFREDLAPTVVIAAPVATWVWATWALRRLPDGEGTGPVAANQIYTRVLSAAAAFAAPAVPAPTGDDER